MLSKSLKRAVALLVVAVASFSAYYGFWNTKIGAVTILFTSDGHGNVYPEKNYRQPGFPEMGGLTAVTAYANKEKKPFLLLDGGDVFSGTPESILTEGRIVERLMKDAGYFAVAVGNHDFDFGPDKFINLVSSSGIKFISANISSDMKNDQSEKLKKSVVTNIDGTEIVITAAMSEKVFNLVPEKSRKGFILNSPEEAVTAEFNGRKALKILLSHSSKKEDFKYAENISGIDIILGGHDHIRDLNPELVGNTLIVHPGSGFMYVSRLKIYFRRSDSRLVSYRYKSIPLYLKKYRVSEEQRNIIKKELSYLNTDLEEEIGYSTSLLSRYEYSASGELALGNFLTDVLRYYGETDFAFNNTGGIRSTISEGAIKVRDIWMVSPYENKAVKMIMKGKDIRSLLEQSVSSSGSRLQVSGLQMVFNSSLPPGRRLLNVVIRGEDGRRAELDPEKEYTVSANSYIAEGGDGYSAFAAAADKTELPQTTRYYEIEYIRHVSTVTASIEGRILDVTMKD